MSDKSGRELDLRDALKACVPALKHMAEYQLDPILDKRMTELGEKKEFLNDEEHAELMAMVAFSERRALEKLEAGLALRKLEACFPDLSGAA